MALNVWLHVYIGFINQYYAGAEESLLSLYVLFSLTKLLKFSCFWSCFAVLAFILCVPEYAILFILRFALGIK